MSFIVVKYQQKELILNSNCLAPVLLDHLRELTGVEGIDLASEAGDLIYDLGTRKEYAKKYLENKATYLLVQVDADGVVALTDTSDKVKQALMNARKKKYGDQLDDGKRRQRSGSVTGADIAKFTSKAKK